jgi:Tfp pilus assembly protein PilV
METACRHRSRGYSLVEVLVAAMLLIIVVFAIVGVVRKGRELDVGDNHRRQARALIDSLMETRYDDRQYNTVVPNTKVTGTVRIADNIGVADVIDSVGPMASVTAATGANTTVPIKPIIIKVRWTEVDGTKDSIVIEKQLAYTGRN